jgi:triosephosphate isomerase
MARVPLVAGNWKMNTGRDEAVRLAAAIAATQESILLFARHFPGSSRLRR